MRFPLALPLFLLLILSSSPPFESEAAQSLVVSNFVLQRTALRATRSLNDRRLDFSRAIDDANWTNPREYSAMVSNYKPLPHASTLDQPSSDIYANMTDTELDSAIKKAIIRTAELEQEYTEANRTLQAKLDEAVEPIRNYNATKAEWERLQPAADEVTTELKTIVKNAKQVLSEKREELPRLKNSVKRLEDEFAPLLKEFEMARIISEDMNSTSANLDKAKNDITQLTPEIPIQTEEVSSLAAITQAKEDEVTELQNNIRIAESFLERTDCTINKAVCDKSNDLLNTYKNALIIAKPQLEEARRVENTASDKLAAMSAELEAAKSTKSRLEPRMRNIADRMKSAADAYEIALSDKLAHEIRLEEARLKLDETESAIKNAENDTSVAEQKLLELSRTGAVKEANDAQVLFEFAETEKEKFDKEIDELDGKVKQCERLWSDQQMKALALQHERDKRKSGAPQTGSTKLDAIIGIAAGIGLLIIAAVIALVVTRRVKATKQKCKKSTDVPSSAPAASVAATPTPSSVAPKVPCEEPSPPRAPPSDPPN